MADFRVLIVWRIVQVDLSWRLGKYQHCTQDCTFFRMSCALNVSPVTLCTALTMNLRARSAVQSTRGLLALAFARQQTRTEHQGRSPVVPRALCYGSLRLQHAHKATTRATPHKPLVSLDQLGICYTVPWNLHHPSCSSIQSVHEWMLRLNAKGGGARQPRIRIRSASAFLLCGV